MQLRVRDFSVVVCGVARVAVLFVEVHPLMVIIPHMLAGAEDPRYFNLGRKQPPPTPYTETSSSGSIRFRYKVYIIAEKEVSVP